MKSYILFTILLLCSSIAYTQKYFTKTGTISFEASTDLEDVSAINKSVASVVDAASGKLAFAVLIKGFEFRKALMQEHFNENYMESSKYPKAEFKGTITKAGSINFQKPGTYPATVTGIMEIHGIQKEITTSGTIEVTSNGMQVISKFTININDYKIRIPGIVKDKISPVAKISVRCNYLPIKK